jgi:O-methyltransferase domain
MRGVVFDQPAVVERAKQFLRASGAADRCRLVGGSFFESVPEGGTLTSSSTSSTTGKTRTRREFCRSFVARFRTTALSC